MLAYEDGPAAMDWLVNAFGFREIERQVDSEGRLGHGDLETGSGHVLLATPSPHYVGPRKLAASSDTVARYLEVPYVVDGVLVYVDDLDAHFERARTAGARILTEIESGGPGRRYRAEDLEGHRWMFMERA